MITSRAILINHTSGIRTRIPVNTVRWNVGTSPVDYYRDVHLTITVLRNLTGSKTDEIVKGTAEFFLK
jgi:hypothetical protein